MMFIKTLQKIFETRFNTSNYESNRPLKIKKQNPQKKRSVIKRKLNFKNYRNCLEATQLEIKINHQEKSEIEVDNLKKMIKNS